MFIQRNNSLSASFEQRYSGLNQDTSEVVSCMELKNFLSDAIAFLNHTDTPGHYEMVAHYLMGMEDHLPPGLTKPEPDIPQNVKNELYNLLRTHRYGLFGKAETNEKTLAKLNALKTLLSPPATDQVEETESQHFTNSLDEWVNTAPDNEKAARNTAKLRIQQCIAEKKPALSLNDLFLSTIPPLPKHIFHIFTLDLSNNRLTSFPEIQQMKCLRTLNLSNNQLSSFAGMKEMNGVTHLFLGNNQLSSFAEMKEMKKLKILDIGGNQLTSFSGMPPMAALEKLWIDNNRLSSVEEMPEMHNLQELWLDNNQLTSIAEMTTSIIDRTEVEIYLVSNPLSAETIDYINSSAFSANIIVDVAAHDIRERPVKPLDQEVEMWLGQQAAAPWKNDATSQDGMRLATFLMHLHGCASFSGADKDTSIQDLQAILKHMLTDKTFRTHCFTAVQACDASCHDNVQATFDDLRMQMANPATQDNATMSQVRQYQEGVLKATLIDEYVTTLGRYGEPLESGQHLKFLLSQKLELPILFKTIKYAAIGAVSNNIEFHITQATQYIEKNLTQERLTKNMAADATCAEFLKKTYAATFTAHNLLWGDVLDQLNATDAKRFPEVADGSTKLHAAKQIAQFGDGKVFQRLQASAEQDLLEKVARQSNQEMSSQDQTAWEIKQLENDPDWVDYVKRQNVDQKLTLEQIREWTTKELKIHSQ